MSHYRKLTLAVVMIAALVLMAACGGDGPSGGAADGESTAATPEGELLTVMATTNIIADVVGRVGGSAVQVTGLMPVGADPHSFTPTPRNLAKLADADAIFINGLELEETLMPVLTGAVDDAPIIAVNEGLQALAFGSAEDDHAHGDEEHADEEHADEEHTDEEHTDEEHADEEHADEEHADEEHADEEHTDEDHADEEHADEEHADEEHADEEQHESEHPEDAGHAHHLDPHTWFDVDNVQHWVGVIEQTLSELDPQNASLYAENAAAYLAELDALEAELDALFEPLPVAARKLVTDHDALGYLANRYEFEIIGTVIPALSTLAAPSAQQLAALQDQIEDSQARAIFVGTTINPDLATQLATDTGIPVVAIYTGSLSDADGPAATYLDFMRYNAGAIADALGE